MTTLAAPNVASRNRLECFALYVLLQGVPFYSGVALTMKLIDASEFVGEPFVARPAIPAPRLATAIQPPPAAITILASAPASGPMARPVPWAAKDVTKPKPSAA